MTREEAREIMSKVTFYWEVGEQTLTQNQINEALDMAIQALEQEPILDKIRAEIEFEVDHRTNMLCAEDVFEILDRYKAESEVSND